MLVVDDLKGAGSMMTGSESSDSGLSTPASRFEATVDGPASGVDEAGAFPCRVIKLWQCQ